FGPEVLLMDEPLGALDRAMREQMKIELRQIQQELGVTVVYVTHDQSEAMALADRVAVLHEGVLQQVDSPLSLYSSPVNSFIAEFVGNAAILKAGHGVDGRITVDGVGVPFQSCDMPPGAIDLAVRPP